jgi:GTP cyclohydrolase I
MEDHVREILKAIGEDPDREGLKETPRRMRESLEFLTSGYKEDIDTVMKGFILDDEYDEMVICRDISLYSLCEHHVLPFYGKCHVAYIPKGKIIGLSKIPRVVEIFSRRLQVQERLTNEIAKTLMEYLDPLGVAVIVEAVHLCMAMRGVQKRDSLIITSSMLGAFRKDPKTRMEFLDLIRGGDRHKW